MDIISHSIHHNLSRDDEGRFWMPPLSNSEPASADRFIFVQLMPGCFEVQERQEHHTVPVKEALVARIETPTGTVVLVGFDGSVEVIDGPG